MKETKTLKISETDAKRLKLAIILSIVFIFLNISFYIGVFPISVSFIIVAIILSRIRPLTDEELMDENETEADPNRVLKFHKWLEADPARKYMSKKDQLKSFRNQVGDS